MTDSYMLKFFYPSIQSFISLISYLYTFNNEGNFVINNDGITYSNSSYKDMVLNRVKFFPNKCSFSFKKIEENEIITESKNKNKTKNNSNEEVEVNKQNLKDILSLLDKDPKDMMVLGVDLSQFQESLRSIVEYNQNSQLCITCVDKVHIFLKTCNSMMNDNNSSSSIIQTKIINHNNIEAPIINEKVSITVDIKAFTRTMSSIAGHKNSQITLSIYENCLIFDVNNSNKTLTLNKVIGNRDDSQELKGKFNIQSEIIKNLSKINNISKTKFLYIYYSPDYSIIDIRLPLFENNGEIDIYLDLNSCQIFTKTDDNGEEDIVDIMYDDETIEIYDSRE